MYQDKTSVRGADGRLYAVSGGACSEISDELNTQAPAAVSETILSACVADDSESARCVVIP